MTVVPSADGWPSDATDEAFVARLAHDLFRQGPELGAFAADRAEDVDAVPGHGVNAATDLGAKAAGLVHRVDPAVTESFPSEALPRALPSSLGVAAASPSSFALRSAPLGAALPAGIVEPWRYVDAHGRERPGFGDAVVEAPYPAAPMVSQVPDVGVLRQFMSTPSASSSPASRPPAPAPVSGSGAVDGSTLYFLGASSPSRCRERDAPTSRAGYDAELVRRDFPALHQRIHGKRLVWLDNAATTQKPQCVLDEMARFYRHDNSNIHRGAHELAARATDAYEGARARVAALLGAASTHEVVFVRGTTEAINLVAQSYGRSVLGPGDEIVLTTLEHHSNIVPWQMLAKEKGASLRPVRIDDRGDVMLDHYASLLGPRTRIVALSQVSNALGTMVPVSAMAGMAKAVGATVVVDGAQGVPHLPVDVQSLGADFYAFSGHKMYGPTGVGVLWGREALLDAMPPWQGGGQMIKRVDFESSIWNDLPYKFEAGTGTIGDAVGLGRAVDYIMALGLPQIAAHEQALLAHGTAALAAIPGLRLIGTSLHKAGVLSFVLDGTQVEHVGRFLDQEGIAVRAGHHCAQPALRHFGLDATVRPSIGLYNTHDDIDVLAAAVSRAAAALRR
jgi:cysteine desulfurase/selenocysteine lyase